MPVAQVHSIETASTHDGPGLRYVLFMQGCKMRCLYCHNRDSWSLSGGQKMSIADVITEVNQLKHFYLPAQGGVTASGGEPILQAPFLAALFEQVHSIGLTTCLDTNGFADIEQNSVQQLIKHTDLVLLDIKHISDQAHRELTGVSNQRTLAFARYLNSINKPMRIRYVVLPDINDSKQQLSELALFLSSLNNIEVVELLPYHQMGIYKWQQLGKKYALNHLNPPNQQHMLFCQETIRQFGINAEAK